jgi:tetratricopeptide (TPR) repeat protein
MTLRTCPKCQTGNPDENKYCRECGERLTEPRATPVVEHLQPVVSPTHDSIPVQSAPDASAVQEEPTPDQSREVDSVDVAVGELLYQTFQLYETGKLDEAMARCKEALQLNSDSTSGHSLLGMIYERKGDLAEKAGADDVARDLYFAAMRQYERVLEINPESGADAEKLRSLRHRLQQRGDAPPDPMTLRRAAGIARATIRSVPGPIAAGGIAAIVVLVALVIVWSRSGEPPAGKVDVRPTQTPAVTAPQSTPAPTYVIPPAPNTSTVPQFISPGPGERAAQPVESPRPQPSREPATSYDGQEAAPPEAAAPAVPSPGRIIPRKAPAPPQAPAQGGDNRSANTQPAGNAPTASPPAKPRGADDQMLGMELAKQGKTQEAIAAFQRAISEYQAQIKAGDDVEGASAGIRTCRFYIDQLQNQ